VSIPVVLLSKNTDLKVKIQAVFSLTWSFPARNDSDPQGTLVVVTAGCEGVVRSWQSSRRWPGPLLSIPACTRPTPPLKEGLPSREFEAGTASARVRKQLLN